MLNKLFNAIDEGNKMGYMKSILDDIDTLITYLQSDAVIEELQDEAIDAVCEILQAMKKKRK